MKFHVGAFLVLVALLVGIALTLEVGRETEVLLNLPVQMPVRPASEMSGEDMASSLQIVEGLSIERTTRLRMVFDVEPLPTWLAVGVALVDHNGEVRELYLTQEVSPQHPGEPQLTAVIDRVTPGEYQLLLRPAWEGDGGPFGLQLRVDDDPGAPTFFWIALVLLAIPPLGLWVRSALKRRRNLNSEQPEV